MKSARKGPRPFSVFVAYMAVVAACVYLVQGAFTSRAPDRAKPAAASALSTDWTWNSPPEPLKRSVPVRIDVPTIGVEARIQPMGLRRDGGLETPTQDQPELTGWYDNSVTPGEKGRSVLLGHLDTDKAGPAVFFRLSELESGDTIRVTRKDGSVAAFEVKAVELHPKNKLPVGQIFGNAPRPELRLITCGGKFDPKAGGWQSNTVVYATLTR